MIDREKVFNGLRDIDMLIAGRFGHEKAKNFLRTIDETFALLKEQEAVVRCKDCKWFIKKFENEGRCIKHDNDYHDPDWFCADGERRPDDA